MELIRVSNLNLASQYIMQAKDICPNDPLIHNELGVIAYINKE
jgi:anaphase-promoting complex subunit 6